MLRNCCSCSLIRFSTSLYCLTLSPLLLCSMGARGWPESHRWSCGWRAHLRPITTLFESNQYLQITSQSVLLQQAIAVVAMASVVLCFSSKVLQVDFKSATLLVPWFAPPGVARKIPNSRESLDQNPEERQATALPQWHQYANCKSAMCKISMQQKKKL